MFRRHTRPGSRVSPDGTGYANAVIQHPRRLRGLPAYVAAIAIAAFGTLVPANALASPEAQLQGLGPISLSVPTALTRVGDLLFWTSNYKDQSGHSVSSTFCAGTDGAPGEELTLYTAPPGDGTSFGDIAAVSVGFVLRVYFVVNDINKHTSVIMRLGFGGDQTTIVARPTGYIGARDITASATNLYWADTTGLYSMSFGLGERSTISTNPNISRVGIDSYRVYFVTGHYVRSASMWDGTIKTLVAEDSDITSLYIRQGFLSDVYYGERDGSAKMYNLAGSTVTYMGPHADRPTVSISYDDSRREALWTDCTTSGIQCNLVDWLGGSALVLVSGLNRAFDVTGDSYAAYWGGNTGVFRYTF